MRRLLYGLVASMLFAQSAGAATLYPRDPDGVNLRAGPDLDQPVLQVLPQGEGVPVIGVDRDWLQVRLPNGQEAWAAGWVSRVDFSQDEVYAVVTTDILNVRAEPGLDKPILTQIRTDARHRLLEIRGEWWRILLHDGREGWVFGEYVRAEAATPLAPPDEEAPSAPGGGDAGADPSPPPGPPPSTPDTPTEPPSPPAASPAPAPVPDDLVPAHLPKRVALVGERAPVLRGRDREYDSLDVVRAGEKLTYLQSAEGWVQVETPRGAKGWLPGPRVVLQDQGTDWVQAPLYTLSEEEWRIGLLPVRVVHDPEGLNLRSGPGLGYSALTVLPQGAALKVMAQQGDWIQVASRAGQTGWVAREYTTLAAHATTRVRQVRLHSPSPGLVHLELEGELNGAWVESRPGVGLLIHVPDPQAPPALLPVETYGVQDLSVSAAGVLVRFRAAPGYTVREQSPGRLVLAFRPHVVAVEPRNVGEAAVYRFAVAGSVRPRVHHSGSDVMVDLAGAALPENLPLPPAVSAGYTEKGHLRFYIPSQRPYALKAVPGGFEVWFYGPGLAGKRIMLDPGHGGVDSGAYNRALDIREKEINLQVALRLKAELERRGAEVLLTRTGDQRPLSPDAAQLLNFYSHSRADLAYRTALANQAGVDLFVSIHANAGDPGDQGTEVYWSEDNLNAAQSRHLAHLAQRRLVAALGRLDRGAKEEMFYVVKYTTAPAALVELAFVSNAQEALLLTNPDWQQRAAVALAAAMEDFFASRP